VLVDVLGALLAGREVFEDTRRAIDAILESFRYGHSGIITRLLRSARIEKVLFAATKADHVPEVQRDHLAALLRNMVALPWLDVTSSNATIDIATLASVISTDEDTQEIDGHRVQVVVGKPVGSNTRAKFFVGNVPARPPRPEAWGKPFLNIPVFEPPVIDASPIDPGSLSQNSYMWFAPLDIPDGVERAADGTLAALMERRFEAYKTEVVMPFYDQYFRNYSRQVVLVDVLGALLAGREVFEDTRRAIDAILESFRYGHSGIITRLLRSARIEKVLFAATKADHVPEVQRDHLAALLRNMVALPWLDVTSSNATIDIATLASVISTDEDTQEIDGHRVQVVVGKPVGSNTRAKFFVGNVPARPPRPEAWGKPFLNIPVFEPPVIDASPIDGIAHINLDLALEYLIGDQLR